jgi:hypothetical protein
MTPRLRIYLELERLMLAAENVGEAMAEVIRDAMDPIWYALTGEERRVLDDRSVGTIRTLEGLRIPLGDHLYYADPGPPQKRPLPSPSQPITDWRKAA